LSLDDGFSRERDAGLKQACGPICLGVGVAACFADYARTGEFPGVVGVECSAECVFFVGYLMGFEEGFLLFRRRFAWLVSVYGLFYSWLSGVTVGDCSCADLLDWVGLGLLADQDLRGWNVGHDVQPGWCDRDLFCPQFGEGGGADALGCEVEAAHAGRTEKSFSGKSI
jgi:hypothetical protein